MFDLDEGEDVANILDKEIKKNIGEDNLIDYRELYLDLCDILSESMSPIASSSLKSRAISRYFTRNNMKI